MIRSASSSNIRRTSTVCAATWRPTLSVALCCGFDRACRIAMTETALDGARPELPPISSNSIRANLLTFGRRLRDAGLPVGSGQVLSLVEALAAIDVFRHEDVYHAARASVVTRPEQIPIFDLEFSRFWRELPGAKPAPLDPFVPQNTPSEPPLPDVSKKKTEQKHTSDGAEDQKDIFHVSEADDNS